MPSLKVGSLFPSTAAPVPKREALIKTYRCSIKVTVIIVVEIIIVVVDIITLSVTRLPWWLRW